MKSVLLVIALLHGGGINVDAAYPMENMVECEDVASHGAVAGSYPDRLIFCWDSTLPFPVQNAQREQPRSGIKQGPKLQPYAVPPAR